MGLRVIESDFPFFFLFMFFRPFFVITDDGNIFKFLSSRDGDT